jgi:hypothetical protein
MLDETNACRLRELLNEYNPLYKDETSTYRERAFNEILECIGMILKEYENECDEMAKWYEEQERKIAIEKQRIAGEIA